MLTPTSGVTQNMSSIHQKKVLQVPKRFLLFQKEKEVIEKKERKRKNKCSKSIEKRYIYIYICEA
jgi:hypothetical protein